MIEIIVKVSLKHYLLSQQYFALQIEYVYARIKKQYNTELTKSTHMVPFHDHT